MSQFTRNGFFVLISTTCLHFISNKSKTPKPTTNLGEQQVQNILREFNIDWQVDPAEEARPIEEVDNETLDDLVFQVLNDPDRMNYGAKRIKDYLCIHYSVSASMYRIYKSLHRLEEAAAARRT